MSINSLDNNTVDFPVCLLAYVTGHCSMTSTFAALSLPFFVAAPLWSTLPQPKHTPVFPFILSVGTHEMNGSGGGLAFSPQHLIWSERSLTAPVCSSVIISEGREMNQSLMSLSMHGEEEERGWVWG